MKIGLIARADNSGLGNMSWEYFKNLDIERVFVITRSNASFPERYGDKVFDICSETPSNSQIEAFLTGLDLVLTIETPYNWDLYRIACKMGVKSVLVPMYEFLPDGRAGDYQFIDLFMCDSQIGFDRAPNPKVFIPFPINRNVLPFKKRTKAKVFLHNAGHGGIQGRNGTTELIKAISMVKADVRFIINSQFQVECNNERVKVNVGNFKNYWDIWGEGDVFILPNKFGGNFLPMQEAMSVGMPIISTDIYPANQWNFKELLIKPERIINSNIGGTVIDMAILSPESIAEKIEQLADSDISKYSEAMDKMADQMSWKNLKPIILKAFHDVL